MIDHRLSADPIDPTPGTGRFSRRESKVETLLVPFDCLAVYPAKAETLLDRLGVGNAPNRTRGAVNDEPDFGG